MVYYVNHISDLTDFEYVTIIVSLEVMKDKIFQCRYCLNNNSDARRKSFGCKELKENPQPIKHYNQKINCYTCPGNLYDFAVEELLFMQEKFNQGIMPFGGTLMDQPAKFISAMRLIEITRSRLEQEK